MNKIKNNKKITSTTKTILFASLIVAMILPFSGMDFAEAEKDNNNDNKKQKELQLKISKKSKGNNDSDVTAAAGNTPFSGSGSQADCRGVNNFSMSGYVPPPTVDWFVASHNYPVDVSTGIWPFCTDHAWQSLGVAEINISQSWVCTGTFTTQSPANTGVTYNCPGGYVVLFDAVQYDFSGNYATANSLLLTDTVVVGT